LYDTHSLNPAGTSKAKQRAASLVSSKSSLKAGTTGYYIKAQVLLLLAKIRNCLRKQSTCRKLRSVLDFEVFLI